MPESRFRRDLLRGTGGLLAAAALPGCFGGLVQQQAGEISISEGSFQPCNVEVSEGATVVWTNESDTTYGVTSTTSNWDVGATLAPDAVLNYTFNQPAVYKAALKENGPDGQTVAEMQIAVGSAELQEQLDC